MTNQDIIGVDILGRYWDICWVPDHLATDRYGHSDEVNSVIVIRQSLRGTQAIDTLLHEITHSISSMTDLDLTESQVTALGMAWAAVFRHNPELLEWIESQCWQEDQRDYQRRTRNTTEE